MSFANLYYKRAVGTPKACYVCYKPTTTVLATINTVDFIYVCDTHLNDPGFATQAADDGAAAKKPAFSSEEIAKVKEEWEERQKRKQERTKEKAKEDKDKEKDKDGKEKDDKESKDEKAESKKSTSKSPPPTTTASGSSTPASATPGHARYVLHRDIFTMRTAEHRRRKQMAQAQALAPRLPGAPKSPLPLSS
ncbi:hypothetical protein EIP86_011362 [Pleurotus ostreatoroseus]|nr:hypothetical protein EIP86_011362 [Pleurotus ostreatoroseus]